MEFQVLRADIQMPDLLGRDGQIKLLPASAYDSFSRQGLRLWCHHQARYGLPTIELVAWLREKIAGRSAIEIGSGAGDLAHHLGIAATDNFMQQWPTVRAHYEMTGQPVIRYASFVEELDALVAVQRYRPDVVVASWVTEWIDPSLPAPPQGGNAWGVKEDEIVASGCVYILIGNIKVHGAKKIMAEPHQEYSLPFLRSRAMYPALDRVWVWNG
jgi:hypothetical protein